LTPAIDIRPLTADDGRAWWELRLEALERDPEAFSASLEAHHKLTPEDVRARLCSDPANNVVLGAFTEGQLVGTAGFVREPGPKEHHKGRVWGVYLKEDFRGNKIGRLLMTSLIDRASQIEGLEQVMLSVAVTQAAATALYRSLGFTPFGREPRALKIGDRYIDEEFMILPLEKADPSSG